MLIMIFKMNNKKKKNRSIFYTSSSSAIPEWKGEKTDSRNIN